MRSKENQIRDAVASISAFEVKILESTRTLNKLEKAMQALKKPGITEIAQNSEHQKKLMEEYKKECENALSYSKLSEAVWNDIDCFSYELNEIFPPIIEDLINFISQYVSPIQTSEVDSRLTGLFGKKCIELHEKYKQYEDKQEDDTVIINGAEYYSMDNYAASFERNPLFKAIQDQIKMKRIIKLQESIDKASNPKDAQDMIDEKFMLIYADKEIHDKLLEVKMNPYSLLEVPDDILIEQLKIDEKKFKDQKEAQYIDEISQFIYYMGDHIFEDVSDVKQIIKDNCDLEFVYFLLTQLSTKALITFSKETQEIDNEYQTNGDLFIINAIKEILNERKDYKKTPAEILEEETCFPLSEELVEKFTSLIKLSELIINKHMVLCDLEKKNLKNSKEFKENKHELELYLEFETEILDTFDFNIDESDTLTHALDNFLELLLKDEGNINIIRKRIGNMLPNLIDDFSTIAYEGDVTFTVHQNFILKTLKRFDEKIQNEKDPKTKSEMIEEKYLQCSYNRCINQDMINADFSLSKITILDENVLSDLLKMNDFEYGYEKNIELYALGNIILYEIINHKHNLNSGYVSYRRICLEEILQNLNDENILDLESQYNTQLNECRTKQLVEKTFKIKKIFKNTKPKYLQQ